MPDPTTAFFDDLRRRRHEPLLAHAHGAVRFRLAHDGHEDTWRVVIDGGDLEVTHADVPGDCEVRAGRETFDRVASGEDNALAATLRGAFVVEGNPELLVWFQRLLPAPARTHDHQRSVKR